MKPFFIWLLSVLLLTALYPSWSAPAHAANAGIVINEIAAYPGSGEEWIEIWNQGAEPVDLADWLWWENQTKHRLTAAGTDSLVAPNELAVIVQNPSAFRAAFPNFAGSIFDSTWNSLNEKGEEIGLINSAGAWVERFTYPLAPDHSLERRDPTAPASDQTNWQEHPTGHSLGMVNSNFKGAASAPGTTPENSLIFQTPINSAGSSLPAAALSTTTSTSPLIINELMLNPSDSKEAFIELKNSSAQALNLAGWRLVIADHPVALGGTLPPHSRWVLWREIAPEALPRPSATVALYTPTGARGDEVKVERAPRDQSYGREGEGGWQWSQAPTPGRENEIVNKDSSGVIWKIAAPALAAPHQTVELSAAGSRDRRGGELYFNWSLGDETEKNGATIRHRFAAPGAYLVRIIATSTAGTADFESLTINVTTTLATDRAAIRLNELLPNPADEDAEEFIELYNRGYSPVTLANWQLQTGSGKTFFLPPRTRIEPGHYLVFYRAVTRLALDDKADTVALISPDGQTVDEVSYENSPAGASLILEKEVWGWTSLPTPGAANALEKVAAEPAIDAEDSPEQLTLGTARPANLAALRELPHRTSVVTRGTVTARPGTFAKKAWYVSDSTGGIAVYLNRGALPKLKLGDRMEITGEVRRSGNTVKLTVSDRGFRALGPDASAEVQAYEISELGDELVGQLVRLKGEITELKRAYFFLDDGSAEIRAVLKPSARLNAKRLREGNSIQITGILETGPDGLALWPRSNEDVLMATTSAKNLTSNLGAGPRPAVNYGLTTLGGGALAGLAWWVRKARLIKVG